MPKVDALLSPQAQPWYRQPLVWMIIAIPASSVLVGVIMLVLSVRTYDGLVADDYYQRGLQINRDLARDQRARSLGLSALLETDDGATRVRLESSSESFVPPSRLTLSLSHSTRGGLDRRIVLQAQSSSDYAGPAVTLEPGRWYLELAGDEWRLTDAISSALKTRHLSALK